MSIPRIVLQSRLLSVFRAAARYCVACDGMVRINHPPITSYLATTSAPLCSAPLMREHWASCMMRREQRAIITAHTAANGQASTTMVANIQAVTLPRRSRTSATRTRPARCSPRCSSATSRASPRSRSRLALAPPRPLASSSRASESTFTFLELPPPSLLVVCPPIFLSCSLCV